VLASVMESSLTSGGVHDERNANLPRDDVMSTQPPGNPAYHDRGQVGPAGVTRTGEPVVDYLRLDRPPERPHTNPTGQIVCAVLVSW